MTGVIPSTGEALPLVITCEHGGDRVPRGYTGCFARHAALVRSHRGHDPGALQIARSLARRLHAPLEYSTTSRLLIDLNRSLHHRDLFSEVTRGLPAVDRQTIIARHWQPFRDRVAAHIAAAIADHGVVCHVSVHTFVPVMDGCPRRTDVGLLYDPSRHEERTLADRWGAALHALRPDLTIHRNAPYRGVADGHTTALRRVFPARRYLGIELEVNQRFASLPSQKRQALIHALATSLATARQAAVNPI
jgi:predicted N-formylglutamate amidohydrolase